MTWGYPSRLSRLVKPMAPSLRPCCFNLLTDRVWLPRSYVGALLGGTSQLHLKPDGSAVAPAPAEDVVKDEIVRAAVAENLVTPHTASVGVLLQSNPLDATKTEKHEVPLQVRGSCCRPPSPHVGIHERQTMIRLLWAMSHNATAGDLSNRGHDPA